MDRSKRKLERERVREIKRQIDKQIEAESERGGWRVRWTERGTAEPREGSRVVGSRPGTARASRLACESSNLPPLSKFTPSVITTRIFGCISWFSSTCVYMHVCVNVNCVGVCLRARVFDGC